MTAETKSNARMIPAAGSSMGRRFARAEAFLVRPAEPKDLQPGALVAFSVKNGDPVLHRLILKFSRKGTLYFLTRGDGSKHFDQAWPAQRLVGEAEAMILRDNLVPLQGARFTLRAKWKVFIGTIRARVGHLDR